MIIEEVQDIVFWNYVSPAQKCWKSDLVFGVNMKDGKGLAIIPCPDKRPEFAPTTWLISFGGRKDGRWYVKTWRAEGSSKREALADLAVQVEGMFDWIKIFHIDPPISRELRDELDEYNRRPEKRQAAV